MIYKFGKFKGVKGSYRGFSAARGVKGHYFCFSLGNYIGFDPEYNK